MYGAHWTFCQPSTLRQLQHANQTNVDTKGRFSKKKAANHYNAMPCNALVKWAGFQVIIINILFMRPSTNSLQHHFSLGLNRTMFCVMIFLNKMTNFGQDIFLINSLALEIFLKWFCSGSVDASDRWQLSNKLTSVYSAARTCGNEIVHMCASNITHCNSKCSLSIQKSA